MNKILKYEFKKLLGKKYRIITIVVLIFINTIYFYNTQYENNKIFIDNTDRYYELNNIYSDDLESLEELYNKLEEFNRIYYMYFLNENQSDILMNEDDKLLIENFNNSIYADNKQKLDIDLILTDKIINEMKYVNSYKDYLIKIENEKDTLTKVSIFQNENSFSYNNIIKTADDFSKLKNITVSKDIDDGVISLENNYFSNMIVIIIIAIIALSIFSYDREVKALTLLRTTKNGRTPLLLIKLLTLMISLIIVVGLVYIPIIIVANTLYGFGDLNRSIQSISYFRECNLIITVKQYLQLFILVKLITITLLGLIFSLIIQTTKSIMKTYTSIGSFIICSYLLFKFIPINSPLNTFKFINMFSFLSVDQLIGKYINLNIFAKPINLLGVATLLTIILFPLLIGISIFLSSREEKKEKSIMNISCISKINTRIGKITVSSSIFINEFYKLFIENRAYLILLGAIIFCGTSINNCSKEDFFYDNDYLIYERYISKIEGEYTREKEEYLQSERILFDEIHNKYYEIENQFINKEITQLEYEKEKIKLDVKEKKLKAFNEVYEQYIYLKTLNEEKNINANFINKNISENLFNVNKELTQGMILYLLMIIILPNIFVREYKSEAINLIYSSKERNKVFIYKYVISFILVSTLWICIYLPNLINTIIEYGSSFLTAPIQSIKEYMEIGLNLNILEFIILKSILIIIGIMFLIIIILGVSIITKSKITTIIISLTLLIPSTLIQLIDTNYVGIISLTNIFNLNYSLSMKNTLKFNTIYFTIVIIMAIVFLWLSFKIYRDKKLL